MYLVVSYRYLLNDAMRISNFLTKEYSSMTNTKKSYTRHDLAKEIAGQMDFNIQDVDMCLTLLQNALINHLSNQERINFYGFGTYRVNRHQARDGRNPRTGKEWHIAAHNVVQFKPSRVLLGHVNPNYSNK